MNDQLTVLVHPQDSNIKALGHTATRVWAVSEHFDAFSNHITYTYVNDTLNGSFYLEQLEYGGNHNLNMAHQRRLLFAYEVRPDIRTAYLGGYKICVDKRLSSVASYVHQKLVHRHLLQYDEAPVTGNSRLISLTLLDASGSAVRPLEFDWVSGNPAIFDNPGPSTTIKVGDDAAQIMALDVSATGRSDIVILSKKIEELNLAVHTADGNGQISSEPISTLFGLPYPTQLIPLDVNGDGRTDLVGFLLGSCPYYSVDKFFHVAPHLIHNEVPYPHRPTLNSRWLSTSKSCRVRPWICGGVFPLW